MKLVDKIFFWNNKSNIQKAPQKYIRQYGIAGVTFKNDDGTSRQKLIKNMNDGDSVVIEKYNFNGDIAIKIINKKGEQIGNLKEKDIKNLLEIYDKIYKTEIFNIRSFIGEKGKEIYAADLVVHFME